jgi:bacillithiol biosynthesis deacetylase BshB1
MTDVLAIVAHPDDADIFCGGTIAKHADRGDDVAIVHLTRGEYGALGDTTQEAVAERRETEAIESGEVLGANTVEFLDFEDGRVTYSLENRFELVRVIREFAPQVLLTHYEDDMHPDHSTTAELVTDAYYMASLPLVEVDPAPCEVENVFFFGKPTSSFEPSTIVDVSGYVDRKVRAIQRHSSQVEFLEDHGGIDAEYDGLLSRVRSEAETLGARFGVEYAEGFVSLHGRADEYLFDAEP